MTTFLLLTALALGPGCKKDDQAGAGKNGREGTPTSDSMKPDPWLKSDQPCEKFVALMLTCRKFKRPKLYRKVGLKLCRGRSEFAKVQRACAPKHDDCEGLLACIKKGANVGAEVRIKRVLKSMGPYAASLGCKESFLRADPKVVAVCKSVFDALVARLAAGTMKKKRIAAACGSAKRLAAIFGGEARATAVEKACPNTAPK